MAELLVGLIDSGVNPDQAAACAASSAFVNDAQGLVLQTGSCDDRLRHGSALAGILLAGHSRIRLLNAQVFTGSLSCTAAQVAAALDWQVERGAQLVNLSVGLREDRAVLRSAVERALAAGVIVVASSPARGEPVFPAAYPGVIRATGDARCRAGEISALQTAQADFGATVRCSVSGLAGASVGCAHLTAIIARYLAEDPVAVAGDVRNALLARATYHGPERRSG